MIKPAIVAVGYNRPDSMRRLLESISKAKYPFDDIMLIISIDQCGTSDEVAKVAEQFKWNNGKKCIRRYEKRQGLRSHVIQCGDLSYKYDAVIILEDDLVVSESFYQYAYEAVNFYENDSRIAGIGLYSHGYNEFGNLTFNPMNNGYDVFCGQFSETWGECWTKQQWDRFKNWYINHENKLPKENCKIPQAVSNWSEHSWGKYFVSYIVEKELFYIVPYISMTSNFCEVGQHYLDKCTTFQVPMLCGLKKDFLFPQYSDAIKYDIFFERLFEPKDLMSIKQENVCVNLNCKRKSSYGKKYLLTTLKLPLKKLKTYGLEMRPIDANIIYNVKGEDIFLYECSEIDLNIKNNSIDERMNYELYSYNWRNLLKIAFIRFKKGLKRKVFNHK